MFPHFTVSLISETDILKVPKPARSLNFFDSVIIRVNLDCSSEVENVIVVCRLTVRR